MARALHTRGMIRRSGFGTAVAIAVAGLSWVGVLAAQNPFAPTATDLAAVEEIVDEVSALAATDAQLAAYHEHFRRLSDAGATGQLIGLLPAYERVASRLPTSADGHAALLGLYRFVDGAAVGAQAMAQFEVDVTRRTAFAGNVNGGERLFLEILARPRDHVHAFTVAEAHYGVAYCAYYSDRLERGAHHIARAAQGYESLGADRLALRAYDGACATYLKMGRVDTAVAFARRGLSLAGSNLEEAIELNITLNYAECLLAIGRPDSALYYAERAAVAAAAAPDARRLQLAARVELTRGNINMGLRRYARARTHYRQADGLFRRTRETYQLAEVLDSLGRAYALTGDFEPAYRARVQAFHLRDSLSEDRVRRDADTKAAELERDRIAVALETSESERAIAQALVAERARERVTLLATGAFLLLAIGFLVYRARSRARTAAELQRLVEERTVELRERGERLEAQTRRLSESNAELERFAYIASHDLKTPLRNITSFLGLIRRRLPADARAVVAEYLEIAVGNARHMNDLITDVLEFSRVNADLGALAQATRVSVTVEAVRQNLHAELTARNAAVETVGDATVVLPKGALDQLLGNLVTNGIKYNRSPRPLVRVVTEDLGERVRIAVTDNGIGIDPAYHEHVFEVFRRLHTGDEYAGTGVGLASCRKIALRLGGRITVESRVGEGSTFLLDLPKQVTTRRAAPAPPQTPAPTDAIAHQQL